MNFNSTNYSTLNEAIKNLTQQNIRIFPVQYKGKTPLTPNGYKDATCEFETTTKWWSQYPNANIGIATGATSGFWVLDIDGEEGELSLRSLQEQNGELPNTVTVKTGSGRHLYFKIPEGERIKNSVSKVGSKLDVRADGGYVIAPPSIHPNGSVYQWDENSSNEIAEAPDWLIDLVTLPTLEKIKGDQDWKKKLKNGVTEGERNNSLAEIVGALLASNLNKETALELCLSQNEARFNPPLEPEEVVDTFNSIYARDQKSKSTSHGLQIVNMHECEMEKIEWLWPDRIASGKLTVIAGEPGLGKSQTTANIASIVTQGGTWPDGTFCKSRGRVLMLSAEDGITDTIKPRLVASGADLELCSVVSPICEDEGQARSFDLKRDVENLKQLAEQLGDVKVIIVDPISAYMGKTDSNNNSDVRAFLSPLTNFAEEHDISIIVVTHLNKTSNGSMINKVIGSIGMVAAARAAYVITKDDYDSDTRYFLPIKNNIGNDKDGFSFTIQGHHILEADIHTSKIQWGEKVIVSEILNSNENKTSNRHNEIDAFMMDLIKDGPIDSRIALAEGKKRDYSESKMTRARERLGIVSKHNGSFKDGKWEWSLFDEDTTSSKVTSSHSSKPS